MVESPTASLGENFFPRQLCEPGPTVHGLAPSNWLLTNPANVPFTWGAVMMIVRSRGVVVCSRRYQSTPHEPHDGTRLSRGSTSKASAGLKNSTDAKAVPGNGRGPSRSIVAGAASCGGVGLSYRSCWITRTVSLENPNTPLPM